MAAPQKLFQFEDGVSIAFTIPKGVANREGLVDRIKNHGGHVTENADEANFLILSAKVATKERLGLLAAQGRVVDALWILESITQKELQPWYGYELGVDEADIPDQQRDIKELVYNLGRHRPLLTNDEIYIRLARQFPHRTSHRFRSLHHENRYLVDSKARKLANEINNLRARVELTLASLPAINGNPTNFGAERGADRLSKPSNRGIYLVNGDDLQPVEFTKDNKDIIMEDDAAAILDASLSDAVVPDTDEEMIGLSQQPPVLPAATEPSVSSVSMQIKPKRRAGGGKIVSSTGISVAAASATSPAYRRRNAEGSDFTQIQNSEARGGGREGSSKHSGPSGKRKDGGKGQGVPNSSPNKPSHVLQFTALTPPPDGKIEDPVGPDEESLPHMLAGPRQHLASSDIPWRDPLPGIRGKDNVKKKDFPGWLNEAFCRQPRTLLPDDDLSVDPTDIEAMAKYLLSHDQGFFDEFYVDYRDGYKHERWDRWFKTHEDSIREAGINLLQHADFTWNQDRQNVRHHTFAAYIQPTWSEELTLNLTPFEEELLAKQWNPVKELEHITDEPFCDDFAQQANTFLETQSLTRAGYRMRPRWNFRWAKVPATADQVKKRTARQWEHRFQKSDRVGELIGVKPEDWDESPSDDNKGCYCKEGFHP